MFINSALPDLVFRVGCPSADGGNGTSFKFFRFRRITTPPLLPELTLRKRQRTFSPGSSISLEASWVVTGLASFATNSLAVEGVRVVDKPLLEFVAPELHAASAKGTVTTQIAATFTLLLNTSLVTPFLNLHNWFSF